MLPPRHQKAAKKAFWAYWPRRFVSERGAVALFLFLALALIVGSKILPEPTRNVRGEVFDDMGFALNIITIPTQKVAMVVEHITGLSDMSNDLSSLREENARLRRWYDRARQLDAENQSLRGLVHLAELPRAHYVTGRVIAESAGAFSQNLIIDAGMDENVKADTVAMTGEGVVGRVMSVHDRTSDVTLLTDVNTRIPVVIENSRHRGVLAGDNTDQPKLLYLPEDAAVSVGERVLTSGHGGVFIPGLPIGVIVSATPGNIRIRPFADLHRLDFVQLIDFGRPSTLEASSAASPASGKK